MELTNPSTRLSKTNVFPLSMAAGLIAATVVIQALFMTVGLNKFKRIEERWPGAMARKPATTTVVWILFLLIRLFSTSHYGRRFITWAAHYRALRRHSIFDCHLHDCRIRGHRSRPRVAPIGGFAAVHGWIIFGWATALIMAVIQRLYSRNEWEKIFAKDAPGPEATPSRPESSASARSVCRQGDRRLPRPWTTNSRRWRILPSFLAAFETNALTGQWIVISHGWHMA